MALQATSSLKYNHGTYESPYFRLVLHLSINGNETPVDCMMYSSKEDYADNAVPIAVLPFYIANQELSASNNADGVVNKFLLEVTKRIKFLLEEMFSGVTFEITGIPLEGK